jgi:hypothetical protein
MVNDLIQKIQISLISQKVAEKISCSIPSGAVTSVFDRSFNIEGHDKFLINIGSSNLQPTPRSILLPGRNFLEILSKVRLGMTALLSRKKIDFPDLKIRLLTDNARTFNAKVILPNNVMLDSRVYGNLIKATEQIESRRRMETERLFSPLSGYFIYKAISTGYFMGENGNRDCGRELETNNDLLQLKKALWDRIDTFLKYVVQQRLDDSVDKALSIVGLGSGMTPSGDDFLAGFLLAGIVLSSRDEVTYHFMKELAKEIREGASDKTTSVSISMIEDASEEDFSKPAMDFFWSVLQSEDANKIKYYTDQLYSIGASSGEDILCGIMTGIMMFTRPFINKNYCPELFPSQKEETSTHQKAEKRVLYSRLDISL